jgi:pimeloyl-ACP methyl ester carboxylesterase
MRGAITPVILAVLLGLQLGGCAPPLTVERLDEPAAYKRLTRNALAGDDLSETTLSVLRRHDLADTYERSPSEAIAALHAQVVGQPESWEDLFALAELSYLLARQEGSPPRYMAAALYAYAFLFPDKGQQRVSEYDPRFREACDLYNLGLSAALEPAGGGEVTVRPGHYQLPFGSLDVALDEDSLEWSGRTLTGFVPTGTLKVDGLQNEYRTSGIGAPMAARISAPRSPQQGFQVAPRLRIPATMLIRVASPREQLASGNVKGTLEVLNIFTSGSVKLGDWEVPVEYDQTAARAVSLVETAIWDNEYRGFLSGTLLEHASTRLVAVEPHRRGRMPVVLVHGTASSPFRWADMVNDLLEDPRIRDNFEFWVFSYETGNPIPYSALLLRDSLEQAIASLGGEAADPALGHVVLVGHSQGGLLVKMLVIDAHDEIWNKFSRRPLEQLRLDNDTRNLVRRALFPVPVKEVDRVIFIATPQRGSYVAAFSLAHLAARLVTLPLLVTKAGAELFKGNGDALIYDPSKMGMGSIYGMTPGSPLIRGGQDITVAPGVHVHSIIPVQGDGPVELGDDGVVKYESAHIEGVESERIVRSSHSTQSNPVTIDEVRRILLLQLATACPLGHCTGLVAGLQ